MLAQYVHSRGVKYEVCKFSNNKISNFKFIVLTTDYKKYLPTILNSPFHTMTKRVSLNQVELITSLQFKFYLLNDHHFTELINSKINSNVEEILHATSNF